MTPQRLDQHRLLAHQKFTGPVDHQNGLLFSALNRGKAHGWTHHSLTDRLGIGCIVLGDLSRVLAAGYIGVSPTKFDQLVVDERMPKPKRIDGRVVWDIQALDLAFEVLPDDAEEEATWAGVA